MVRNTLLALSGLLVLASLYLIFLWVPTEQTQGVVQRIFYFHVAVAWSSFLAFLVVFVASIGYLLRGWSGWDRLAYASAEIGVILTSLTLLLGMLWARAVWEVWWTWEPRLTTTLVLWFIYVAYLMLRAYAPRGGQAARYSAVLAVVGFVDVPIVFLSVRWAQGLHPSGVSLEPSMVVTLVVSVLAMTALYAYLLYERTSLRASEETLERILHRYA